MKTRVLAWLLSLAAIPAVVAAANYGLADEPLAPDKAFQFSAQAKDANTVIGTWTIADGYYLYQNKFQFVSDTGGITLGKPDIPAGKKKKDEFFGEVETHRHQVQIQIPVERTRDAANTLSLTAKAQGCADMGICYPPYQTTVKVSLPAASSAAPAAKAAGDAVDEVKQLGDRLGLAQNDSEFLPPDQAFALSSESKDGNLVAHWKIADGYYLYKDKIQFRLKDAPQSVSLGTPELPEGQIKDDEFFGRMTVFHDDFSATVPVQSGNAAPPVAVDVTYQGCSEKGLCYPPQTHTVRYTPGAGGGGTASGATAERGAAAVDAAPSQSEPAASEGKPPALDVKTVILTLLGAFGVGFLLTFTPCVLPMIPILSSIIVGQAGEQSSTMRGGVLSIVYVLGTAVTWTAAGILAGQAGDQLQAYFQNPWAIGIFAAILVLLALSMFGFYEIQMPSSIQSKLQERSQKVQGGTVIGVFIMGVLSAAIVGACVSPLLISVLGLAVSLGDPVLGGATMFFMALGTGVVLIAIGFGAGFLVPRAGAWMDTVKHVFGVLLLGVAVYLLGILPQVPVLYLWAVLLIVTGVFMGATQSLTESANGWRVLWKGVGTVLVIWGVLALLGAFADNRDILRPIQFESPAVAMRPAAGAETAAAAHGELFRRVETAAQLDQALAQAKAAGKPAMVDFYADWCTECQRMEKGTFSDPRVRQYMGQHFTALQVDVTGNDETDRAVKQRLNVFGPPALLFFDAAGRPMKSMNFYGYKPADEFLELLQRVVKGP